MKKVLLGREIILPIWYTLKDLPTHFLKVISSWVKHRPILTFEMILSDNNARGLFFPSLFTGMGNWVLKTDSLPPLPLHNVDFILSCLLLMKTKLNNVTISSDDHLFSCLVLFYF